MFHVGEKVVYPAHGAGIVESIEDKDVFGSIQKCYIIRMVIGNMKVIIPVNKIESLNIRVIGNCEDYQKVLDILSGPCVKMEERWNIRYRQNELKIREGCIFDLAIIANYLANMDRIKKLSTWEKKMYCNVIQLLISELSLIKNLSLVEIEKIIDEVLNVC